MNFRLVFFFVQFAATFARSVFGMPKKWAIKELEPKFVPVRNRRKRIEQKRRKQLWQKFHMIRY